MDYNQCIVSEYMVFYSIRSVGTWVNPYRLNYGNPYPVCEGIRDYFAKDVIAGIHIGMDELSVGSAEQPALETLPSVDLVFANVLQIEKTALRGVTFLGDDNLNADQLRFVGEHGNELCMWDRYKVLVGTCTKIDVLFPAVVLAEDECPDARFDQLVDYQPRTTVQFGSDAAITVVGNRLQLSGGVLSCRQATLQLGTMLIVALIDSLEWSSANQKRDKARLVGSQRQ